MTAVGVMAMPKDFKYEKVFLEGRPQHDFYDSFRIRHPEMTAGRRAKIFAPFDALKGFSEAISSKEVLYMDRIELSREGQTELSRRLAILYELTRTGRLARKNRVSVEVTYYEPCSDEEQETRGFRGRYRTICGICAGVDPEVCRTIRVEGTIIEFEDILRIENDEGLFEPELFRQNGA